jgi:adenosylcobinamide-GDP ribazoletransferase
VSLRIPLAVIGRALQLALAFLTVVPVRTGDVEVAADDLAASRLAYPVIGLGIGLVLAAVSWGLARSGVGPGVSAFVLVAAGTALTGALHLDGLADTADGLFLWGDRARRLAVMRDPNVGSYGVAAVVLVVLGKYAALSGLAGPARGWAVIGAAVVSRSLVLVSAGTAGYARPEGTGRILVEATTLRDAAGAGVLALIAGAVVAGGAGLLAAVLAIGLACGVTGLARARLGGVTGDTLGAVVETGELVVLLTLGMLA